MRLLAGIVIVLVPALASGQSMSEAAQKERERRQKLKASGGSAQVIDNESLKTNKGSLANDPGAAQASPTPSTEAGDADAPAVKAARPTPRPPAAVRPGPPVVSEQEWRGRARETRRRVADRQRRYDYVANLRLKPDQSFTDETGKQALATPENVQRALVAAQAGLDAAKKDLEDLEQEARRQNVPPGLLR